MALENLHKEFWLSPTYCDSELYRTPNDPDFIFALPLSIFTLSGMPGGLTIKNELAIRLLTTVQFQAAINIKTVTGEEVK